MDFNGIASQLISSAIVGLVTWLCGVMAQRLRAGKALATAPEPVLAYGARAVAAPAPAPAPTSAAARWSPPPTPALPHASPWYPRTTPPARPRRPVVDARSVAVQIAALQFGVNLVGMLIRILVVAVAGNTAQAQVLFVALLAPLGTLFLTVGFFVIALMVEPASRWRHLVLVALGTTAATLLVNSLFGVGASTIAGFFLAVCVALFQTFLAMGLGGGLASLAVRAAARGAPLTVSAIGLAAWPTQPAGSALGGPGAPYPALGGQSAAPGVPRYPPYPTASYQPYSPYPPPPSPAPSGPPHGDLSPSPARPLLFPPAHPAAAASHDSRRLYPHADDGASARPQPLPVAQPPVVSPPIAGPRPAGSPHFQPW